MSEQLLVLLERKLNVLWVVRLRHLDPRLSCKLYFALALDNRLDVLLELDIGLDWILTCLLLWLHLEGV